MGLRFVHASNPKGLILDRVMSETEVIRPKLISFKLLEDCPY